MRTILKPKTVIRGYNELISQFVKDLKRGLPEIEGMGKNLEYIAKEIFYKGCSFGFTEAYKDDRDD